MFVNEIEDVCVCVFIKEIVQNVQLLMLDSVWHYTKIVADVI